MPGISSIAKNISSIYGFKTLKVTPQELGSKSDEINGKLTLMKSIESNLTKLITSTQSYWNGEASDMLRGEYNSYKSNIEEMFLRVSDHVENLRIIGLKYSDAEHAATGKNTALPSDAVE